jgi:hypothetical protein
MKRKTLLQLASVIIYSSNIATLWYCYMQSDLQNNVSYNFITQYHLKVNSQINEHRLDQVTEVWKTVEKE